MKRYKVTTTYWVDTSTQATGGALARQLSLLVQAYDRGDDRANQVEEVDFRFEEIVHPANLDRKGTHA